MRVHEKYVWVMSSEDEFIIKNIFNLVSCLYDMRSNVFLEGT